MDPLKALDSTISKTALIAEKISNTAGRLANGVVSTGKNAKDAGIQIAKKGIHVSANTANNAWNTTSLAALYLISEASDKGAQVVDFSARAIDKTLTLSRQGVSEAARYAAIGMESTFVAGLVIYDNARKITAKSAQITRDKATRAWNTSKAAAQDLSWEKVQVQTGDAVVKLGARIAHEQLSSARRNDNPTRFADVLLRQDGDENFAKLITEDDAEFFAAAYDVAVQNAERLGTDYAQYLIDAAKPYPALQEAIAQTLENQLNTAHRQDNYGRSPETRQAYRSLALMFNQVGGAAELTSRIDPAMLKTVHAAGKKMGYTNEASEILLYARRTNKELVSEFNAQDIAGAVRTQKKELGVDELPDNFQPGKTKVVATTQDDEIDYTLGMYGPHSWF